MTHANTIKITEAINLEINAVSFAKKTPWVIYDTEANQIVGVYMGRTEAREAKAAGSLKGQILKASDCAFEVIEAKPAITFPLADLTKFGIDNEGRTCCPKCGCDEIYEGHAPHGIVIDEEYVFGCHHCDWQIDTRTLEPKKTTLEPKTKVAHVNKSEIENPCKRVWHIADEMLVTHPGAKRKEILEACQAAGIAFFTARTQYQQWLSVRKEMAEREAQQAAKK